MTDKMLIDGNEAICRGAIAAGCRYFFGYPITPQNEIPEYMARELPKLGGVFVQTEDELSAINMVYGAAAAGARVMTSSSSLGISLMGETLSHMYTTETPAVVVDVVRLGPGSGTIGTGQTDYLQATKAGGHGGYHNIVLAPASPQDCFDYMQLGFYLADKYRMVTLVLSDFIVGRMAQPVELKTLELGPLPAKDWALTGTAAKGGKRNIVSSGHRLAFELYGMGIPEFFKHFQEKHRQLAEAETRFTTYLAEDAKLLLVAYGSSARIAETAVDLARDEGLKVGIFRPITLWPFPKRALQELALKAGKVLVVEDSGGQLVEDVECIVQGKVPVHLLGIWGRRDSSPTSMIHPERVLQEVKNLL